MSSSDDGTWSFVIRIALPLVAAFAALVARRRKAAVTIATTQSPADDYERMLAKGGKRDEAKRAYRSRTGLGAAEANAAIGAVPDDE